MRFAVAPADVERIKQFRLAPRDGGADVCRPTLGSSAARQLGNKPFY